MQTFEDKLRSMTGKDVLLAMIAGLEKEHVKVDMGTFGNVEEGVCFGCAATNAICEIAGVGPEYVEERASPLFGHSAYPLKTIIANFAILEDFENAVDALRQGYLSGYNRWVPYSNLYLPLTSLRLPELYTEDYKQNLHYYKAYADSLPDNPASV